MRVSLLMMISAALTIGAGSAPGDEGKDESGQGRRPEHARPHQDGRGSYFEEHGYTRLNIPAGHYPPPGECRIWYPDRPPGHQPPPFKCGDRVPAGAWLLHHPPDLPNAVHVTVYEPGRPGVIRAVGEFQIGSGAFIRVVLNR